MKFLKKEYSVKKTVGGVLLEAIACAIVVGITIYFCTNDADFIHAFEVASSNKSVSIIMTLSFSIFFGLIYIFAEFASYVEDKRRTKKKKVEKK